MIRKRILKKLQDRNLKVLEIIEDRYGQVFVYGSPNEDIMIQAQQMWKEMRPRLVERFGSDLFDEFLVWETNFDIMRFRGEEIEPEEEGEIA
jgi:hypothetical protein